MTAKRFRKRTPTTVRPFFLLSVYGVLSTTDNVETRDTMLSKLVASALRGLEAR